MKINGKNIIFSPRKLHWQNINEATTTLWSVAVLRSWQTQHWDQLNNHILKLVSTVLFESGADMSRRNAFLGYWDG
jgi:hypothetical protein